MTNPTCYRCKQPMTPQGRCGCGDGVCLVHGDCREVLPMLEAGSVDLVLTDPPYLKTTTWVWPFLAEASHRLLRDGGYFVSLCGHFNLPEVLGHLCQRLQWLWIGGARQIRPGFMNALQVRVHWKPCIWLTRGKRRIDLPEWPTDMVSPYYKSNGKALHAWQQDEGWFRLWCQWFSLPGEIVLDPFAGSGTTGRACKDLGRRCILIEIEEKYCRIAAERLRQGVLPLKD